LMVDEDSGIRVPVKSEGETARAMGEAFVRLAEDPELRKAMGQHARKRVIRDFSWESKAARILKEYHQLEKDS